MCSEMLDPDVFSSQIDIDSEVRILGGVQLHFPMQDGKLLDGNGKIWGFTKIPNLD